MLKDQQFKVLNPLKKKPKLPSQRENLDEDSERDAPLQRKKVKKDKQACASDD